MRYELRIAGNTFREIIARLSAHPAVPITRPIGLNRLPRRVEVLARESSVTAPYEAERGSFLTVGAEDATTLRERLDAQLTRSFGDALDVIVGLGVAQGAMGSAAATPAFLERLGELLADDDPDLRRCAAEAVGHIGSAAATPAILERLGELLADGPDLHRSAARAVASFFKGGVRQFTNKRDPTVLNVGHVSELSD